MTFQSMIKDTFETLIDASPNKLTVTYDSTDYDAVKTVLNRDIRYQVYGVQSDYRFSVIISWDDFATLPSVDETVTINSVEYRILSVEEDSTDVAIRLDLGQLYA
jgi:hypothetical protein